MYNLYSRASQSCLVSNAGVGGAGDRPQQQLTQRFNGGRFAGGTLKGLRLSLPFGLHDVIILLT